MEDSQTAVDEIQRQLTVEKEMAEAKLVLQATRRMLGERIDVCLAPVGARGWGLRGLVGCPNLGPLSAVSKPIFATEAFFYVGPSGVPVRQIYLQEPAKLDHELHFFRCRGCVAELHRETTDYYTASF